MRLSPLQKWMQAVVVHPGTTEQALRSRAAARHLSPEKLESVLLPSKTLKASERIAIYQEMYPLRMRDALSSDYPALEHFLGDRFEAVVRAYCLAHPSLGYTLNRLGDHMPAFLGRQRTLKSRAFLKDLAKLELAVTEAFDAPQADPIKPAALEAVPAHRLAMNRLIASPSLRLVSLEWNADAYLDTIRDEDHRHPKPKRRRSFAVVLRRNYSVYRQALSESAFAVLADLQAGHTIAKVVQRGLARRGRRRASADEFGPWFKDWTSEGMFVGIASAVRTGK